MKKKHYRFLGLVMALAVIVSNIQLTTVSAEESVPAVEDMGTQAEEDSASAESGTTDESIQAETEPVEEEQTSEEAERQETDTPDIPEETVAAESENSGEAVLSDEGGQSWEDANSWRYQNGQLISVQSYARSGQYTTWPNVPGTVAKGIDVSEHQGTIDWQKVKDAGVDFVIIRCGYGDNETNQDDKQWQRNVSECERLGIPYGVYIYSYAMSTTAARSEAEHVLRLLAGHNPSYPVYLDMENEGGSYNQAGLGAKTLGDIAETFCNMITNAGYEVGIYANTNWFTNYLTDSRFNQWERWVAQYNTECTYRGSYSMWQCSSEGRVNGISGNVDLNLDFDNRSIHPDTSSANIVYQAHVQDIDWQTERVDGTTAGTTGLSKQVEALKISKGGALSNISGDIKYRAHVQDVGTQGWVYASNSNAMAGTTGQGKRIEALQIAMTGTLASRYDVYYRVHVQNIGWMKWVKGSEADSSWTGSNGLGLAIEAVEIQIVAKGAQAPGTGGTYTYLTTDSIGVLSYVVHQQDYGTLPTALSGQQAGRTGESRRLEAAWIAVNGSTMSGAIQYRAHVQDIGWQSWVSSGNTAGTTGQSKRMEAIQINLTGELGAVCDVWYRVHVQNYGWLGWAKNGQIAGTTGLSYRIEAIEIQIVPKGTANTPGANSGYYKTTGI